MGIRFLCEACGKKLNVKDDLAGKKGRCPKCNEKILIPTQSTLQKDVEANAVEANAVERKASVTAGTSAADSAGTSGKTAHRKRSSKTVKSNGPPAAPDPSASSSGAASAVSTSTGSGTQSPDEFNGKETVAETPPIPNAQIPTEPTPDILQPKSAFEIAPDASWFVRPISGGQFGPADANTMKSWLSEGRVGRDSLVWREGWEEWENAEKTFELEFQGKSDSTKSAPPVPSTKTQSTSGSNIAYHQMARRKAKTMGIILIVALVLLTIVLAVLLVLVANGTIGGAATTDDDEKTTLLAPATSEPMSLVVCLDFRQTTSWQREYPTRPSEI